MATPNPQRELDRLQKQLKGSLPPCLLILGASDFFRQSAFDLAFAAVPKAAELRSIDGDRETDGRELDDLRGGTLFGTGTFLAVRRGETWLKGHAERLLATIPAIKPGSGLLLEIKKLDKRTKLAKALVAAGELFEFRDLYTEPYDARRSPLEAEMVGWIAARSKALGCPLQPESAYLVMTSVGTRPSEILDELERVASRVGKSSKALSPDDLRGTLTCSFESTPFEFAAALLDGDRRRATRALAAMYSRGAAGRDGARIDQGGLFPFITSWLYQQLAQLYEGRRLLDAGVPLRDVPGRVGVRVFVDRFVAQLQRNSERRLRRGLELLHDAQRELRTAVEEPEFLLLRFLARYFGSAESAA